jgi:hypothetical protein
VSLQEARWKAVGDRILDVNRNVFVCVVVDPDPRRAVAHTALIERAPRMLRTLVRLSEGHYVEPEALRNLVLSVEGWRQ